MKYVILFLLSTSAYAAVDPLFGKIKWSYEIFENAPDGSFSKSIEKIHLSDDHNLKTGETVKLALQNIECVADIPWMPKNTNEVVRTLHCKESGRFEHFTMSSQISCGPTKLKDSSVIFIQGQYCEDKKCDRKSYKIVFSCSL
jgi:hypothetical protein